MKGATRPQELLLSRFAISIHAPVKGATSYSSTLFTFFKISIHAPVKGATMMASFQKQFNLLISIHAPVKGATLAPYAHRARPQEFQSTHP